MVIENQDGTMCNLNPGDRVIVRGFTIERLGMGTVLSLYENGRGAPRACVKWSRHGEAVRGRGWMLHDLVKLAL